MRVDILTLFPEMFKSPFDSSIIGRARARALLDIRLVNIRDFAVGRHRQVDDTPYGGGAGMIMQVDVVSRAVESVKDESSWLIYLSPQGKKLRQSRVCELARKEHIILLCGHYEGIDYRAMRQVDEELSVGDYVLSGGEIPAMLLVDAVTRLLPGALGGENSAAEESFSDGLLEYPQYTRPAVYKEQEVPEILLSGHHEKIRRWRKQQSLFTTLLKRPELLLQRDFDQEEKGLLEEILFEHKFEDKEPEAK